MSDLNIVVENGPEVQRSIAKVDRRVAEKVQGESIEDFAENLKEKIEETAPVDTGEYKNSWEMKSVDDGVVIYNTSEHGKYLVFPNSRMVGVPSADDPGRGVLHNVRGITFEERSNFRDKVKDTLKKFIG